MTLLKAVGVGDEVLEKDWSVDRFQRLDQALLAVHVDPSCNASKSRRNESNEEM